MGRYFIGFLLFVSVFPLTAGQKSFVMPLIPASQWQLRGSAQVGNQELQKLGYQAAVEQEFGVSSVTERTYVRDGMSVAVFLEKAADPSSAFGLFTFYQNSNMHPVKGVQLAVAGPKEALMARGRYFIRALAPAEASMSSSGFRSLLTTVGGAHISTENAERLPQRLPKQGLVPGTERYLLGVQAAQRVLRSFPVSAIGFRDGVEALLGTYDSAGARLKLLAVSYPTPQLAQISYEHLKDVLNIDGRQASGSVYGRLEGSYVLLVLNANSPGSANRLLSEFRLSEFLTWSPRSKPGESLAYQLVTLVLANFELIGVIVVCGVLTGVVAAIVKRMIIKRFPESALSKGQDNQLIKLKL